jgi:hypothetical protein
MLAGAIRWRKPFTRITSPRLCSIAQGKLPDRFQIMTDLHSSGSYENCVKLFGETEPGICILVSLNLILFCRDTDGQLARDALPCSEFAPAAWQLSGWYQPTGPI